MQKLRLKKSINIAFIEHTFMKHTFIKYTYIKLTFIPINNLLSFR